MSVSLWWLLWGLAGWSYSFDSFYIKGQAVCWDAGEVRIYDLGISFNLERYNTAPWLRQFKDPAEVSRHPLNSESYAVFYGVQRMLILPLLRGLPGKCTTSIGHQMNSQLWHYAVRGRVNHTEALICGVCFWTDLWCRSPYPVILTNGDISGPGVGWGKMRSWRLGMQSARSLETEACG